MILAGGAPVAVALSLAFVLVPHSRAAAQLDPGSGWRTIATEHFRVHFTPATERLARRAAVDVEKAYAVLASELVRPRGTIDVVVSDDVDFSNGFATTFPSNRIVVYANPPLSEHALRFNDDWLTLVLTHELVHIFHLDRARGLWRLGQLVFGRNPSLFPQQYLPRWIVEGLAVYYESKITGGGRIEGTTHQMVARAGFLDGRSFTRLDELSLATSRFPYGNAAYVYGSLLVDELARRSPEGKGIRAFVERAAVFPFPYIIEPFARNAFGVTLQEAWAQWSDSVRLALPAVNSPVEGWREWRGPREYAAHPRWVNDSTIALAVNDGRDVPALVEVRVGDETRLARRNGLGVNAPVAGGYVFSQIDFTSPYQLRSDLYARDSSGERRLTRGARLSQPDVRADGRIVAVQATPGSGRLVTLDARGAEIVVLADGSPDTTWTEPRWSPDGRLVAASRWRRGGYAAIVVVDVASGDASVLHESRAVNSAPHWTHDGSALVFSSDRTGAPQLYRLSLGGSSGLEALSNAPTGLFEPQVSRDGRRVAALAYRAEGFSLGVSPLLPLAPGAADTTTRIPQTTTIIAPDSVTYPSSPYRAWPMLLPRYWMPTGTTLGDGRHLIGGLSSGSDVLRRHAWTAQGLFDTGERRVEGGAAYRFAGLRQPLLDFSYDAEHDYFPVIFSSSPTSADTARRALRRTTHTASFAASVSRPRVRTNIALTVGGDVERRRFHENDDRLAGRLSDVLRSTPASQSFPSIFVTGFFGNTKRPSRAISPEDGISVSGTARQRWLGGAEAGLTRSLVGTFRGFRSLDFPGYAHHVLALRLSGAAADRRATSEFSVGGVNGSSVEVLPGVEVGGGARTFPVRGFAPGTQYGLAAAGGTAEYRAPFLSLLRGYRLLPLFFDRSSLTLFGDAAAAWCAESVRSNSNCVLSSPAPRWLASAGGELSLDAAVLDYDVPYRVRVGVAAPVTRRGDAPQAVTAYFTFGSNF